MNSCDPRDRYYLYMYVYIILIALLYTTYAILYLLITITSSDIILCSVLRLKSLEITQDVN